MESRHTRYFIPAALAKALGASHFWRDLYHLFLTISWPRFLSLIALLYIAINVLFALVYLAGGNCLENARPGSFLDAFFFSVDTIATVGYGSVYPRTLYANIIVAIEVFVGLLGFAIITGLMFAKFSRPTARVLFSRVATVAPFNGVSTLMFRAANERRNQILEAQMQVNLVRNEVTTEGQSMRRFHDLKLVRSRTPIFFLTWTVMHAIDETSPLYGATTDSLAEAQAEIVITLTGIDETVSQTIHTRHSFHAQKILWNARFVDILSRTPDGRVSIDYDRFHDVVSIYQAD
jgi:inward rectifier potassium channel